MKKNLLLIILPIVMSIGITIQSTAQGESYGKWVLPIVIDGFNSHETLLLSFMSDEIQYTYITAIPGTSLSSCEIAAGGYNPNYDLEFHVLGDTLYSQNLPYPWNFVCSQTINTFHAEYQIINRPGYADRYYSFYTGHDLDDVLRDKFTYNEIWFDSDIPQFSCHNYLFGGTAQGNSIAFAITQEESLERQLYATTYSAGDYPAGLRKWTITQNGVGNMTDIITTNNSSIAAEDFPSYNLELKTENNGDVVIAWITSNDNSNDTVFVVINGTESIYDLNLGRIGGIEFSSLFDDRLYVSCSDTGIVAINYNTGAIVKYLYTTTDDDFGRTFLQTAPDGHIYAVSNDGTKLGQISMQDEIFTPDYFGIPGFGNIVSTHRIFDGSKYYILPENDREYCPLTATLELQHVCPGQCYGEAWIDEDSIICGHGPYTYTWFDNNNQIIDSNINHIYDLCEGSYHVEMQDFYGLAFEEEFEITVDSNYYDHDWYIVDEDEEWPDFELSFLHGIRIKAGFELELSNSHLKFLKPGKIIIEQGARLIVDHSILSYYPECDDKWQGIEVLGDETQHQYTINGTCYQGYLELKNNSEVSYSENAVSLYKTTIDSVSGERIIDWDSCGGIVRSNNTNFINNTRAVHFIPYSNFNPYQIDMQMDNLSSFKLDTFDINIDNIGNTIFYKHADLHGVKGINFHGCTFTNSDTNFVSQWNFGIAAYGAGFDVKSACTQPITPCPPQYTVPSSFNGFYWGIGAYGSADNIHTFRVRDAKFENNVIGIYDSEVNYAVMVNNQFKVGSTSGSCGECEFDYGIGIDVYKANGFAIEDNTFEKFAPAPVGLYSGIRVFDCPSVHDIIYRNQFNGLSYGNYAEGTNRRYPIIDQDGVEYQCNQNTNNAVDFIVTDQEYPEEAMIRTDHGSKQTASGNTFSSYDPERWHFRNEGTQVIDWFYCDTCSDEEPISIFTLEPIFFHKDISTNHNICPDHYGGGGTGPELSNTERQQEEMDFAQYLSDYNSVLALYESLIDGGNTDAELMDIQTAQPDDMWAVRSQLLGHSPHLSQEVLRDMSERTDVFPDDILLEILSANPDELKKDTLLLFLEQKEDPLPSYMIDILYQVANNVSYKTVLKRELAQHHAGKTQAAQDIIRSILHDSIVDMNDYRNWLDNLGGMAADKKIIASYLSQGDTASAISLLNLIPSIYELEGEQSEAFNDYKTLVMMQIAWKQQGRNIFQLDSTEINALTAYADSSTGSAKAMSRNILSYIKEEHYCECMHFNDSTELKMRNTSMMGSLKTAFGPEITVKPNPAHSWAAFDYSLQSEKSSGYIKITNASGKTVEQFSISGKQGQFIWDTRGVKAGIYIYTLSSSGMSKSGKLIIR
ncbi:MAG: T9SS type A sorting domain-containing protein [Bacteroidetes bacterium]|nr:T9SS type A sorting domain-containing protein [Bacteroidota bacterium]